MAGDSESRGAQVVSTSVVFTALAVAIVALRLLTRTWIAYSIGPEDWLIILAVVCMSQMIVEISPNRQQALSIVLTVLIGQEVKYGTGRHMDSLSPETAARGLKVRPLHLLDHVSLLTTEQPLFASIPVYIASLTITKCSLILQYIRIFVGKTTRRICWSS